MLFNHGNRFRRTFALCILHDSESVSLSAINRSAYKELNHRKFQNSQQKKTIQLLFDQ